MFNTKFYKNRWRPLSFRRIWFFYFFLSWRQNIKIRCIHEAFSVRKSKSSNYKKELCEIGEEAIWKSRFTSFSKFYLYKVNLKIFGKFSMHFSIIKKEEWKIIRHNVVQTYKKWEKTVVREFNISFALIFRKWKKELSNLTPDIPN